MAKKACIETFGCQMNVHDSERMAGLVEQAGYELTDDVGDADLVVINTCSVREKAEEKLFGRLGALGRGDGERPLVAVTGCVAQQEGGRILERSMNVDVVVGTQALRRLPLLVNRADETGESQVDVNPYDDVSFPLGMAVRNDPVKAYVTIIEGCNDFCAFCVVPYTRGHERMRPAGEILAEVRHAAAAGHREVHLLGQIVNHYHDPADPGHDFAWLLHEVHAVPGVERIRFASPHPRHVTPAMIAAMRDLPKVCNHLHLPLQSGSSAVLKKMRRRYSRETYLALVEQVRTAIPDIGLSTDIIVGFPGETDRDFEDTLSLVEAVGFHGMFSFMYSQRPNTLAAKKMPDTVPDAEKSKRLTALQGRQKAIQARLHAGSIGQTVNVLVDSRSRRQADGGMFSGRTAQNTVVNFPGKPEWLGSTVAVRVDAAGAHSLRGEVVAVEV